MLYNTLILPHLSYCSEVWGRTYVTNLNPLFVKQKKFVRIIGRLSKHDHTTPLFLKFKILKLFASCFMYLVYLSKLPKNIQCFYVRNIPDYDLRKPYYSKKKRINSCLMIEILIYYKRTYLWYKTVTIYLYIKESIKINY